MSSAPPRPLLPARTLLRLRRLAGLVAALVVLVPAAANAVPIEDFSGYQPQTKCSPDPKPGTVALSKWLMNKYPGSGSSGISRACGASGVSEHKEGRAFDWRVSASSARDRGYVKDFFATIFAPDKDGNKAALARRMGIMYLIWDDHIYASYRGFEKRAYTHSGCRTKKSCSPTLRHRDHVHISLSRAGGAGETSWYHRNDPGWQSPVTPTPTPTTPTPTPSTPPPVGDPTPIPVGPPVEGELRFTKKKQLARVAVPLDKSTYTSKWKLRKGKQYKITVAGVVGYGAPDQVGDANCVWSPTTRSWLHSGTGVKVNGDLLFGRTCTGDHVYATTYVPTKSKPLRVKLASTTAAGTGRLVLTVSKKETDVSAKLPTYPALAASPAALPSSRGSLNTLAETVQVPANATTPVLTTQEVEAGARYRMTVSGVADLGGGVQSDGQCIGIGGAWYQSASLDLRTPGDDHGNLYVNGYPFGGDPTTDCAAHSHVMEFTAAETRQLQLAVWDPFPVSDNSGALTVTVQRLSSLASPQKARGELPQSTGYWTMARDTFAVNVASPEGTVSNMRLRKGERVTLVVSGAFTSHGVTADATCVNAGAGWVPRDPGLALEQDPLELWVDGVARPWGACNDAHTYSTSYVVEKSGPIRLAVMDLDFRDNAGSLEVALTRG